MQTISVSNKGDKTYNVQISKGVAMPTSGTREAKHGKFDFLKHMEIGDSVFVSTSAEATAMQQALNTSAIYAEAKKRGRLKTFKLAKYKGTNHEAGFGEAGKEYGVWMVPHKPKADETEAK